MSATKHLSGDKSVLMIGLDFGSTTSRAMIASAQLERNQITGRIQLGHPKLIYRSEAILTPFQKDNLCISSIDSCLDQWLADSGIDSQSLFAGGVIITGLAAEKENAFSIARCVRERINQAIVATANDPCMESWLAFMGNSLELSRAEPHRPIINLDIGGGTTNRALGLNGNITLSGCYYIGARHFRFEPGSYRLTHVSKQGIKVAQALNIHVTPGTELDKQAINLLVDYYVSGLEAIVTGHTAWLNSCPGRELCQRPFELSPSQIKQSPIITFSGGVGELLYQFANTGELPETTVYGDLGVDLCQGIAQSQTLCRNLYTHVPEYGGRATVYGLTLHSAELSGNTLFMPNPEQLPVNDLPIIARLALDADRETMIQAIDLASKSHNGACIRVTLINNDYPRFQELKQFGEQLAEIIELYQYPPALPLLLLVPKDFGKVIGNYTSRWGKLPANIMAVDEVPDRNAGFVSLGKVRNYVIPVYFYGMQ